MKKLVALALLAPSIGWAGCNQSSLNGIWNFQFSTNKDSIICSVRIKNMAIIPDQRTYCLDALNHKAATISGSFSPISTSVCGIQPSITINDISYQMNGYINSSKTIANFVMASEPGFATLIK